MTYKVSTPNLMVKDVNKTIDFYTNILGFEVIASSPSSGRLEYAIVQADNVTFMFQEEESIKKELPQLEKFAEGGGMAFYIQVLNAYELYEKLKDKVTVIQSIHKSSHGSIDFSLEDCNGYILILSQRDKNDKLAAKK